MADEKEKEGFSFKKIAENALSTLVAAIVVGACVIVWNQATSIDSRVEASEDHMEELVDKLSVKLSAYEVQLTSQSNQIQELTFICKNLTNQTEKTIVIPRDRLGSTSASDPTEQVAPPWQQDGQYRQMEQKAIKADIQQFLKK